MKLNSFSLLFGLSGSSKTSVGECDVIAWPFSFSDHWVLVVHVRRGRGSTPLARSRATFPSPYRKAAPRGAFENTDIKSHPPALAPESHCRPTFHPHPAAFFFFFFRRALFAARFSRGEKSGKALKRLEKGRFMRIGFICDIT